MATLPLIKEEGKEAEVQREEGKQASQTQEVNRQAVQPPGEALHFRTDLAFRCVDRAPGDLAHLRQLPEHLLLLIYNAGAYG